MWFVKSRRAQNADDYETWVEGLVAPTLNVFENNGDVRATVLIVTPFMESSFAQYSHGVGTLRAAGGTLGYGSETVLVEGESNVRRLTPLECERLQGFPDDWTVPAGTDSQRYRQMGNAVTVNVVQWIGGRLA